MTLSSTVTRIRGMSSVTSPALTMSLAATGRSLRRRTARTRATSSLGLNGFVT